MKAILTHAGANRSILLLLSAIIAVFPMTAFSLGISSLIFISYHFIHALELEAGGEVQGYRQAKKALTLLYGALVVATMLKLFYL